MRSPSAEFTGREIGLKPRLTPADGVLPLPGLEEVWGVAVADDLLVDVGQNLGDPFVAEREACGTE